MNTESYTPPPDFTLTGFLSPEGDYYPTQGWGYLHEDIAQLICMENGWEVEVEYGGTTAQRNLVFNGFIRFDHYGVDFRVQPTIAQVEEIRKMHQWKLDNPNADDHRDYRCWRYIGEFLQWCDHDPTMEQEDAEWFESKLKKVRP